MVLYLQGARIAMPFSYAGDAVKSFAITAQPSKQTNRTNEAYSFFGTLWGGGGYGRCFAS